MKSGVSQRKKKKHKMKNGTLNYAYRGKEGQKILCARGLNQATLCPPRNELGYGIRAIAIGVVGTLANMKDTDTATWIRLSTMQ